MPRVTASLFSDDDRPPRHSADDERVKKWIEEEAVIHFLNAYTSVIDEELSIAGHESPDFIGERADGRPVGIELTAIRWSPEMRTAAEILSYGAPMDAYEVLDRVGRMLAKKAQKRRSPTWTHPDASILVLMLEDAQLATVNWVFDPILTDEWASYGFEEVWIADYSELDAYSDIELFCLHPSRMWGYYPRVPRKPYG